MYTRQPFYEKPFFLITFSVALFLAAIFRLALPHLALSIINRELNTLSPHVAMVLDDIEIQVVRGEYTGRSFRAFSKKPGEPFMTLNRIMFRPTGKISGKVSSMLASMLMASSLPFRVKL